jgi:hypothetical protein
MKSKQIKTKPSFVKDDFSIAGWLEGKHTYLWIGNNKEGYIILDKKQLYKLAKNIVKEFRKSWKVKKFIEYLKKKSN